jgi:heme O synthase-like polyprenyltransferase
MLRAFLELIRPANVVTALADVLAGYAVAGLPDHRLLPWLLASTACLYAGGVVLNDFFDRELDREERPERPIPSGRVSPAAAGILGAALLGLGILTAAAATAMAGAIAAATAGCILLYDAWGKRQSFLSGAWGPLNMGMCRGLNLLLGIAAAPAALHWAWPLALLPLLYITAVTALSRGEVHGSRRGIAAFALISLSLVLIALVALSASRGHQWWAGTILTMVLAWRILPAFWAAYQVPGPGPIRHAIKTGVLSLVLLDAVIGAAYAGAAYSVVILATAVVAASLARIFSVT